MSNKHQNLCESNGVCTNNGRHVTRFSAKALSNGMHPSIFVTHAVVSTPMYAPWTTGVRPAPTCKSMLCTNTSSSDDHEAECSKHTNAGLGSVTVYFILFSQMMLTPPCKTLHTNHNIHRTLLRVVHNQKNIVAHLAGLHLGHCHTRKHQSTKKNKISRRPSRTRKPGTFASKTPAFRVLALY